MTSLRRVRFRGWLAVVLASLTICLGVPTRARAVDDNVPSGAAPLAPSPASPASPAGVPEGNSSPPSPAAAPAAAPPAPAPVPQLQLQDEGPSAARPDGTLESRPSAAPTSSSGDQFDDRPFWKSWIFWAVTGALVVGGIGLTAYTASQTNSSLAVCPPEVQVSLGCYGAGRGQ